MTTVAQTSESWTTRRLLKWITDHFTAKGVDSPRVVAEMLLGHVLGCERLRLYMDADRPASATELSTLRALVKRAGEHEPVQYLTGTAWFFGREFEVDRSTLIPRPSTETLVETVLNHCKAANGIRGDAESGRATPSVAALRIADIGTGTGCVAISLVLQLPAGAARITATDIEPQAIELAKRNAARHKVAERIDFLQGDLLEPLRAASGGGEFDVICSNPPYISDAEWAAVPRNVKEHEPERALRGGTDGLDVIRRLISESPPLLRPGGLLTIEIAESQKDAVLDLAKAQPLLGEARVVKDHEGLLRVLVAQRVLSL